MLGLYISIAVLLFVAICLFGIGFYLFNRICKRQASRPQTFEAQFTEYKLSLATETRLRSDYEWFDENKTRDVCAISNDGLRLVATLIDAPKHTEPKGIILLFHGYHSNARRDFCMQLRILHNAGYHLLIADQRAHDRSDGKYICYGVKEAEDVLVWRKEASKIYGNELPIAFMGLSMGGATVLMSSALVDASDTSVRCVVADCPFSSPKSIVSHVMKNYNKIPPQPLLAFANFWCRWLARFSLDAPSAAECLKRSHLPALLFHGDADDYVPIIHSKKVVELSPKRAELITISGAKHAEAIYYDEKRYNEQLFAFLNKYMKPAKE